VKLLWTPRALAQLEAIHAYIGAENPIAAATVITTIEQTAAILADFPNADEQTDRGDVRTVLAWPYPYRVYYRLARSRREVRILRVRDVRRRPTR
jgi:plasmid stabilization system protein ParE